MLKSRWKKLTRLFQDRATQGESLRWMMDKTRPYIGQILLLLLLDLLLVVASAGGALMNKRLIDSAVGGAGGFFDGMGFALLAGTVIASLAVGAMTRYLSTLIHERYAFGIRMRVYDGLLKSKWAEISRLHTGDLITRLTSDIDTVASGIAEMIPSAVQAVLRLFVSFGIIYYYEPLLALSALLLGPVGVLVSLLYADRLREFQKQLKANESAYRAFMQESAENVMVIKSFEREDYFSAKLLAIKEERLVTMRRRNMVSMLINTLATSVHSIGYLVGFGWGLYRLAQGDITYGTMSMFLSLVSQVQGPILSLSGLVAQFANVLASTGRIMQMNDIPREQKVGETQLSGPIGIRVLDVRFSYKDKPVLHGVSMDICPGQSIALIGESGAGKTTIARLLLALLDVDSGAIVLYDEAGQEERISPAARRLIAHVPQGNTLLSGTIRENLLIGNPQATDEEMWHALYLSDMEDTMRALPMGLETVLTEKGGAISEGQAQRIAIARAILRNAPILILDEATSALDLETERRIVERIKAQMGDTTCIVITHRPSLLDICQQTYHLEKGLLFQRKVSA